MKIENVSSSELSSEKSPAEAAKNSVPKAESEYIFLEKTPK